MDSLQGKVAIVTGAASGFGRSIAQEFVRQRARVVVADRNGAAVEAFARELGSTASASICDVAKKWDVENTVNTCVEVFGVPDIVVNNAGVSHRNQPMLDVDEETFDRVFSVNVKSLFHMARAVVPLMRGRKSGVILNVGSVAGIRPRPGLTWYNGSKGAINVLSKSMAVELAPDNIRVNAICPVMSATGMLEEVMGMPDTPENRRKFTSTIPLGRFCDPMDVARVAVFLASDAATFLTGLEMPVDGGRSV